MTPEALVYSADAELMAAIKAAVRRTGLSPVCVTLAGASLNLLRTRKFPAIVIDCRNDSTGAEQVELCRRTASNKSSIVFAMTERQTSVLKAGASFVLKRSLDMRELTLLLKTAQGMILREFRRYVRVSADLRVVLENDEHTLELTTVNVSEGGVCVHGEIQGWNREHALEMKIPGARPLRAKSCLVWSQAGKSGIQFDSMSGVCKNSLAEWLQQNA